MSSLTAKEFWKLPPEERKKRVGELSPHELFLMRISAPTWPDPPQSSGSLSKEDEHDLLRQALASFGIKQEQEIEEWIDQWENDKKRSLRQENEQTQK